MNVSTPKDRSRADRVGVIDVGGGLRGAFGAGVLDRCLDEGVSFDVCLGVSAGSGNMVAYLAGQRGRNRLFYTEYPQRKEYMSVRNLVTKGSYLDLDYVYSVLSNSDGEYPLDYDALLENPAALVVVATDALAGKAVYFRKADLRRDDFGILKASSGIPVVCRPCRWEGGTYFDGGIADPVPLARAFAEGCARVVVVLTRPRSYLRSFKRDRFAYRMLRRRFPRAAEALRGRAARYNLGVARALELEREGRALVVAPDDCCGADTLTRDPACLERLYEKGYEAARAVPAFARGA